MPRFFLSDDEVRRGYHSGLSVKAVPADNVLSVTARATLDKQVTFETSKYLPPEFKVVLRSNKNSWLDLDGSFAAGKWSFALPAAMFADEFNMKLVLKDESGIAGAADFWMEGNDVTVEAWEARRHFSDFNVLFAYKLEFKTNLWRPNHLITLRNQIDGWGRDIFGYFAGDTWTFYLDRDLYPANFQAKFVLDQCEFMVGPNLDLSATQSHYPFTDAAVLFPASPTAYQHGYDNFTSIQTRLEQISANCIGREQDDFDVIIIGSGMGGGALADALSDMGVKVLVLEAGGLRFPVHMFELPRSEMSYVGHDELGHFHNKGPAKLNPGVHFNLGGRSVYWSGVIPRMQAWEFRDGWPDSVRDYLTGAATGPSGYDRAEKLVRMQKSLGPYQNDVIQLLNDELGSELIADDLPRSMHQPDLDSSHLLRNVIERSTGGFSTTDLLLDSLGFAEQAGRHNLRINLHHFVKRIETSGNRATEVVCEDLVGKVERRYHAKFVVLACGSLESAKLALISGLSDPNNKIGRGLTDHPSYFYNRFHDLPTTGALGWLGDPHGHAKVMLRHKAATFGAHAYNIELLIGSKYWDTRHADDDLWTHRIENSRLPQLEFKFIFDSPLDNCNELVSNGEGQKPNVHFRENRSAESYKSEIVEMRNKVLGAFGIPAPSTTYVSDEWREGITGSVHHAGGTLRMSHDGSGVVDENLKFEQYDNLYCCDVSVSPSIPAANPSLTLVALALRLADTLKARL